MISKDDQWYIDAGEVSAFEQVDNQIFYNAEDDSLDKLVYAIKEFRATYDKVTLDNEYGDLNLVGYRKLTDEEVEEKVREYKDRLAQITKEQMELQIFWLKNSQEKYPELNITFGDRSVTT